ncbi:MAG TPA: hypothetical protein VGI83_00510, partial [Gemmatimonadales bacterium]
MVVHTIALGVLVVLASRTFVVERTVTMIPLDSVGAGIVFPQSIASRISRRPASERALGPARTAIEAPPAARDTVVAAVTRIQGPVVAALPQPDTAPRPRPVPPRADQGKRPAPGGKADSAAAPIGTHRRLGPGLGDGRLWAAARQLARDMLKAGAAGVTRGEVA